MQVDPQSQPTVSGNPQLLEKNVPIEKAAVPTKSNAPLKIALVIAAIIIVALCGVIFFLFTNNPATSNVAPSEVKTELKEALGKTVAETKKIADEQGYAITLIDYDSQKDWTDRILNSNTMSKYYRVIKDDNGIKAYSEDDKTITYVVVVPLSESWDKWFTDSDFNNSETANNTIQNNNGSMGWSVSEVLGTSNENEISNEPPTEEQTRAIARAEDYLKSRAMSYREVVSALTSEKFSQEDAKYATAHCSANWEEQAGRAAEKTLNTATGISYTKLLSDLENRGFTHDDAVKGIENNHPDWVEEAAEIAGNTVMYNSADDNRNDNHIIEELVREGFTYDEATAGLERAKQYKRDHPDSYSYRH